MRRNNGPLPSQGPNIIDAAVPAERKTDPAVVAGMALYAVAKGEPEIVADELTRGVKRTLSSVLEG